MKWLRKRAEGPDERTVGHPVTPADVADLAAAREALAAAHRESAELRSRWPVVQSTVARLREIRRENHLAADLHTIFTTRD